MLTINGEDRHLLVVGPFDLLLVYGIHLNHFEWNIIIVQKRCKKLGDSILLKIKIETRNHQRNVRIEKREIIHLQPCCRMDRPGTERGQVPWV